MNCAIMLCRCFLTFVFLQRCGNILETFLEYVATTFLQIYKIIVGWVIVGIMQCLGVLYDDTPATKQEPKRQ